MAHQHHPDLATEDRDVDESRFIVGGEADGLGEASCRHMRHDLRRFGGSVEPTPQPRDRPDLARCHLN